MQSKIIDISNFKKSNNFYSEINLIATIKSFNLQAIRKRYLESQKNKSGRVGSIERRKVATGGIVKFKIKKGEIKKSNIILKVKEPRGIDFYKNKFAISTDNEVHIFYKDKEYIIHNEWFSYIHTVKFSPYNDNIILISSSGFDSFFEYDFINKEKKFEWFAWENGFNIGKDEFGNEVYITRDISVAREYKKSKKNYLFIEDPSKNVLPTAKRAAFINSVYYYDENNFIATFFHQGKAYLINRQNGKSYEIINSLDKAHGTMRIDADKFLVTNTAKGEVIIFDLKMNKTIFNFKNLPGKSKEVKNLEWLQNSIIVDDNIITIDSNRNSFIIFSPEKKLYDIIPYNPDWAIQDIIEGDV